MDATGLGHLRGRDPGVTRRRCLEPAHERSDPRIGDAVRTRADLLFGNRDLDAYVLSTALRCLAHGHAGRIPRGGQLDEPGAPDRPCRQESRCAPTSWRRSVPTLGRMDVEVIGWLYQFYISARKKEINDSEG